MIKYFTVSIVIETICFIVALICLIRDRSIVWKSMIAYLFITCLCEVAGRYFAITTHNNHWVYNIFLVFEAGFTLLMFRHLFHQHKYYKPAIISGLIILIVSYVYELKNHGFFVYNNLTYTVMSVCFVIYSLYYYYLLLNDDKHIQIITLPSFWWVAGTLFFYFANTACNIFNDNLDAVMITPNHRLSYFIFKGLNVILYSFWAYSFICRKWLAKLKSW